MKHFFFPILLSVILSLTGCAAKNEYLYYHPSTTPEAPESLLAKVAEIEKENFDNIKTITLSKNELSTHHLVVVKKEEPLHAHPKSDLWAMCLKGEGEFVLGNKRFKVHPGSSIFVPRGVPHQAISNGKEPIAALVIFTPPYDGKDSVPVAKK